MGRGITPVVPSEANRIVQRATDFTFYSERNLVERFSGKLKAFRAIATRPDKLAGTFLAAIQLVSTLFWLNCGQTLVGMLHLDRGDRRIAHHFTLVFCLPAIPST